MSIESRQFCESVVTFTFDVENSLILFHNEDPELEEAVIYKSVFQNWHERRLKRITTTLKELASNPLW